MSSVGNHEIVEIVEIESMSSVGNHDIGEIELMESRIEINDLEQVTEPRMVLNISSVGSNEIEESRTMVGDIEGRMESKMVVGVNVQRGQQDIMKFLGEFGTRSGLFLHLFKTLIASSSLFFVGHGFEAHTVCKAFMVLVSIYVFWSIILVACEFYIITGGGCDLTTPETIGRWVFFEWVFGYALLGAAVSVGSVIDLYSLSICDGSSYCVWNGIAVLVVLFAYIISIISRMIMYRQQFRLQRDRYSRRSVSYG